MTDSSDTRGIDRRSLLAGLGTAAAVATIATSASAKAPAIGRNLPDVIVVGAGAFGGWTALELRERGAKVVMVDQYGPGNPRGTSGDESRLIRSSYDDRAVYSAMALKATAMWQARQREFGRTMIVLNGSLRMISASRSPRSAPSSRC